jgi:catechol 2,3-dioxygenase-like lactoylglutathione lyase family enzyme
MRRNASLPWLLFALTILLLVPPPHALAQENSQYSLVSSVESIGMTVSDMDRAVAFYSQVLTFQKVSDTEVFGSEIERLEGVFGMRARIVRMKLGGETIELTEYLTPRGRPIPVDSRSNDHWFQHIAIIVSDMEKAYRVLRQNRVQHASAGPQRLPDWNKNAGGIRAFYFKDPDDHVLEILQFPEDKGNPKWHRPTDRLFLGIDHTAIVVSDTDASLKFYRDVLGFQIGGESENYGAEQEHLNNVFGARLRITSIHAASGPSIELLQYLAPTDGRPFPPDTRASDLWHWQTRLVITNADSAMQHLYAAKGAWISPGAVTLSKSLAGFRKALTIRDPDGHALQAVENPETTAQR